MSKFRNRWRNLSFDVRVTLGTVVVCFVGVAGVVTVDAVHPHENVGAGVRTDDHNDYSLSLDALRSKYASEPDKLNVALANRALVTYQERFGHDAYLRAVQTGKILKGQVFRVPQIDYSTVYISPEQHVSVLDQYSATNFEWTDGWEQLGLPVTLNRTAGETVIAVWQARGTTKAMCLEHGSRQPYYTEMAPMPYRKITEIRKRGVAQCVSVHGPVVNGVEMPEVEVNTSGRPHGTPLREALDRGLVPANN